MTPRATLAVLVAFLLVSIMSHGAPFELFRTSTNVALFSNTTSETFSALRVTFAGSVDLLQALGIGTDLASASPEADTALFTGSISPFSTWEIDWALDGPVIIAATWLRADGSTSPINIHTPVARFVISLPMLALNCAESQRIPFRPIYGTFSAIGCSDPDGDELVYTWVWSDGAVATGYEVARLFDEPGRYTVTLTVRDPQGNVDVASRRFEIPHYLCPSCCSGG